MTELATSEQEVSELDTRGLRCPLPLLKAKRALVELESGALLRIFSTDRGSVRDFKVYAELSGHQLISSVEENGIFIHVLEKK
ncbi:MAG: tRNA 2-thiouridine synthesizing protein A [Halieaceae bacterium]